MLDYVGYDLDALRAAYAQKLAAAGIGGDEATRLIAALEAGLTGYTYLAETPAA
jgi:arginine decarboxylase